jgi:hypothetical protein
MRTPPDYHNPLATAKRPAVRFLPRTARFLPRTAKSETWNRHINGTHSPKGRCFTRKALFHAALATLAWGFRDETGGEVSWPPRQQSPSSVEVQRLIVPNFDRARASRRDPRIRLRAATDDLRRPAAGESILDPFRQAEG